MEAFVLKLKYITRFSLVAIIALMAVAAPMKLKAQDDEPNDSETIIPPSSSSSGTPPTIIDDSDSGSVSDVGGEYDG